jgi:hypothetical protein
VGPVFIYATVINPDGTERNTTGLYYNCKTDSEALAVAKKVVDQDVAAAQKKADTPTTATQASVASSLNRDGKVFYRGQPIFKVGVQADGSFKVRYPSPGTDPSRGLEKGPFSPSNPFTAVDAGRIMAEIDTNIRNGRLKDGGPPPTGFGRMRYVGMKVSGNLRIR